LTLRRGHISNAQEIRELYGLPPADAAANPAASGPPSPPTPTGAAMNGGGGRVHGGGLYKLNTVDR
jgi:hypothetical protein